MRPAESIRQIRRPKSENRRKPEIRNPKPRVWYLRIAYALPTLATQSGRGQPHSKTLRDVLHVRARASVSECGCPLPLSAPQKVIGFVRLSASSLLNKVILPVFRRSATTQRLGKTSGVTATLKCRRK